MAVCLVPAVKLAVERLNDLDKQLRTEESLSSQEAAHYLNQIAEAIKELESSRKAAHEELEVETIKTSKLRHQVQRQRDKDIGEISAAVAAARGANTAEMNRLRLETNNVTQETDNMDKRRKDLEGQNIVLAPERDLLKANYDRLLVQLNLEFCEKANAQIQLDQMRDETQAVQQKLARSQSERKRLQEELIHRRTEHRQARDVLEKEIREGKKAIRDQNEMNAEEKRKLDEAMAQLEAKEEEIRECTENISQLERRKAQLNTQTQEMEAEMEAKLKQSDELEKQKTLHERELQALSEELKQKLITLQQRIAKVDAELDEGRRTKNDRIQSLAEASKLFSAEKKEEDEALADHNELIRCLNKSKQKLEEHLTSIAKYKLETKEMQEEMKHLHESNSVTASLFQKKLDDLRMQLVHDRQRRTELEQRQDELDVSLETFKEQQERSTMEIRSDTAAMRSRYKELREEEERLQEQEELDMLIEELRKQISGAQEDRKRTETKLRTEIHELNAEAESITRAQLEEEKKLEDEELALLKVEAQFQIELSHHESLKERTEELQKRKDNLKLSIKESKEKTAALLRPKEDLKLQFKRSRLEHLQKLRSLSEQLLIMERSIYESSSVLERAEMENSRLRLCTELMQEEMGEVRRERSKNALELGMMKEEAQSIHSSLTQRWVVDKLATEDSTAWDRELVVEFHALVLQIQRRKHHIRSISSRLERELLNLNTLLEIQMSPKPAAEQH